MKITVTHHKSETPHFQKRKELIFLRKNNPLNKRIACLFKCFFFKQQKALKQQKNSYRKEVYYKLFKLFIILFRCNKPLAGILLKNIKSTYYRNICIYSYKAKSLTKCLKISRISLREISNKGLLFGLCKIS